MSKLDGEGLREVMKERHPRVSTVFMTGYARGDAAHDAYPHLLIKPFSPRQLLETVRSVLDGGLEREA